MRSVTTWYGGELAPDDVHDASFSGDGTAMWLLLDRRVGGRQFALARVDTPGTARVVAAAGPHTAEYDYFSIVAVAPDDSLVAVNASGLVLVETTSGISTAIDGQFLAFISSATADTWAGEPFRPVQPIAALEPVLPAYPTLPPIDETAELAARRPRTLAPGVRRSRGSGGAYDDGDRTSRVQDGVRRELRLQRSVGRAGHDGS